MHIDTIYRLFNNDLTDILSAIEGIIIHPYSEFIKFDFGYQLVDLEQDRHLIKSV